MMRVRMGMAAATSDAGFDRGDLHRTGTRVALRVLVLAAALMSACNSGPPPPAAVDTQNDACTHCRMAVSDKRFAAQLAAPKEEARFFDDIGCLRGFLSRKPALAPGTVAYVADYRDGSWIAASAAHYLESEQITTPMGSGIVAFGDAGARDKALIAGGATARTAADLFGAGGLPDGRQ